MRDSHDLGSIGRRARDIGPWALLLVVPSGVAQAQQQFAELLPKRYLPMSSDPTTSLPLADFDGDGDVDLLQGKGSSLKEVLLLNDGTGIFADVTATHLPAGVISIGDVAHGDVDGDGDADLLLPSASSSPTQSRLYVNDGTAHFADEAATRLPSTTDESAGALFGDVDVDGDLDLFLYRTDLFKQTGLYLNDGLGTFADVTAAMMPVSFSYGSSNHAVAGDVDGDGDLDLVQAKFTSEQLHLNNGVGRFTLKFGNLPDVTSFPSSLAMVDVDGDLDLDIVVGSRDNLGPDFLYSNDGSGVFSDASFRLPTTEDDTEAVAIADVDGDSDPDIVYGNRGRSRVALNDGAGNFFDALLPDTGFEETLAAGVSDLDGDGDQDLALGGYRQDRLYWNDGDAGFTNSLPERIPLRTGTYSATITAIAIADFDVDGDRDILTGNGLYLVGGDREHLYLNDGTGLFADGGVPWLPTLQNTLALAAGDVDGDADPDVLVAGALLCGLGYCFCECETVTNRLFFNDGRGAFDEIPGRLPVDANDTFAVALEDLDGDADLDIVAGNWMQQSRLYRNGGAGDFADVTAGRFPIRSDKTRALAFGDVDGDSDLDIVLGNEGQQDRLYVNEGLGAFFDGTAARMPPDTRKTRALELGDVDRDGDLDLVLGRDGQTGLYLNDGTGSFLDRSDRIPLQSEETWALRVGDVDEDGDIDLLLANLTATGGPALDRLYLNDGTGRFADGTAQRLPPDLDRTLALALEDLDGDLDLDVVAGNNFTFSSPLASRLYLNLHRQLRAPLLPFLGRTYEVELHAEPGYGTGPRLAVVAFSLGLLPTPLATAYGELFLQAPLLFLPATTIPSPSGSTVVTLPVPADPSLAGVTFYLQAAVLGGGPELTGYLRDTFAK